MEGILVGLILGVVIVAIAEFLCQSRGGGGR
jgi:hypothetical protein